MMRPPFRSPSSFEGYPLSFFLPSTHGTTCVYFGDVTHVHGGEGLSLKVCDPITELIVTRHDDASLLALKGVVDVKYLTTSITMVQ